MTARAMASGAAAGIVYTLSPLLVVVSLAAVAMFAWARRTPDGTERRWLTAMLVAAVGARLVVLGGLFLSTDHFSLPFGSLFGDEEYFIRRSLWIRNVALGFPISGADFIYAYDEYSETSYLWVLATLQILFGPSPYGVHLVNALLYLAGAIVLYKTVRPSFGLPASLIGLALLFFLPSLFAWSISALKEPLFFALMSGVIAATVAAARCPSWRFRAAIAGGVVLAAAAAQSIRVGGLLMAGFGTAAGVLAGTTLPRPRVAAAAIIGVLMLMPIVFARGAVQDRIVAGVQRAAQTHWGHVNTRGRVYTFLDGRFYQHRSSIQTMTLREGALFVVNGLRTYVTVPTPAQVKSRAALSFLPEQMVWYALVALAPIGLVVGLRRDPFLAAVLFVHAVLAVVLVALTSGNVGTLVRHRGLAIPYIVWFSALGFSTVLAWLSNKDRAADPRSANLEA